MKRQPTPKKRPQRSLALGASLAAALAFTTAPRPAAAVGEQNGRVAGAITEAQTQVPIGGATIKVSGPALIGGPREVTTDDEGRYQLVELPPGRYDLQISVAGVKPIARRVVVRQGETVPLDIAWSVELAGTGVIEIREERHLTRPDSTQTGTVLTADTQGRVASGRSYQNIALQAAGVHDRAGTGNPTVKGALLLHNRYLVDGLDITDPVTGTFSANINFDSIGSVEVLTGGMEAQYNALGGIVNLNTNGGSNEWRVDASVYVNHGALSAGQQYGPQLYSHLRPFARLERPPQQSYQANANVGGPLVRNRLWFNASFEYRYREAAIPAGPPLGVQHPPQISNTYLARLKLTWAPSSKHRVTLSASADPATFDNVQQSNDVHVLAEDRQEQGGVFSILQWDYFRSDRVNVNVQAGFQYNYINYGPQGWLGRLEGYDRSRPQHVNNDDGTVWRQGSALQLDKRYTVQFDPSISLRGKWLGHHDAKMGVQSRFMLHGAYTEVPGGSTYSDAGGGPLEAGLCDPAVGRGCYQRTDTEPYENQQLGVGVGLFLQDRWRPIKRLTILPGLRFDYGYTRNSLGETVSSQWGFGPRLGFTLDLTGDQKTILSAFYGRANETLSLLAAAYADVSAVSKVYEWDGKQFQPAYQTGGPGGYRLDPNGTPPHTDEVTVSLRREVGSGSVVGADYTYKRLSNVWDSIEINQIWDPTGARVVGYGNGKEEQIFLYTTPDANYRTYQGVDLILEARPTSSIDIFAAYTLSFLYGPGAEQFAQISGTQTSTQFYNPRLAHLFDGFLPEDIRHQLKLRASYTFHGVNVGVTLNYSTGTPLTRRYFNLNDGGYTLRRTPQGTEPGAAPNDPGGIAEFRVPDLLVVNARVSYDLHALVKQHVVVIADLFNAFNLDGATALEARDVPTYGQVRARQTPLRLQLGVRYLF